MRPGHLLDALLDGTLEGTLGAMPDRKTDTGVQCIWA